jgi:hypothetical protein
MNELLISMLPDALWDSAKWGARAFWRAAVGASNGSWREIFLISLDNALGRLIKGAIPPQASPDSEAIQEQIDVARWLRQACSNYGSQVINAYPADEIAKLPTDEASVWRLVEALINEGTNGDSKSPAFRGACLRPSLFPLFKSELGELLLQEPYQAAWRACWTSWLFESRNEALQIAQSLSAKQQEEFDLLRDVADRLSALANVPFLLENLVMVAAKTLGTGEGRFDLWDALGEVRHRVSGRFVGTDDALSPTLSDISQRRRSLLKANVCVGREQVWNEWTASISEGGLWLVTAPAGGGKSTAIAHWLERFTPAEPLDSSPPFICSHFFERNDTQGFWGGLLILGEQLLTAHGLKGNLSQSEGTQLQAVIRLLLERAHPAGLIVVFDGLDEAQRSWDNDGASGAALLRDTLPEKLGDGVTVILSMRTVDGEATADKVRCILNYPALRHFSLPPLEGTAVCEWLSNLNQSCPSPVSTDEIKYWSAVIHARTSGLPLYLYHLLEQLSKSGKGLPASADEWEQVIGSLPQDFETYVQNALGAVTVRHEAWRSALRFIALAHGPLSEMDLMSLTARSGSPLQPEDWNAVPWDIYRWLERRKGEIPDLDSSAHGANLSTFLWSFQHEAIAQAFISGPLRVEIRKTFKAHLLDFCREWHIHRSPYALRHIAGHLLEAGAWDTVYEVAQDRELDRAVHEVLPDEPEWELNLIRTALEAALEDDNAGKAAEFLLVYRSRIRTLAWEHPLRALHRQRAASFYDAHISPALLRRAQKMSDIYPAEDAALWYLLIVAHLHALGNVLEAQTVLDHFLSKPLNHELQGWRAEFAIFLLEDLLDFPLPIEPNPATENENSDAVALVCLLALGLLHEDELPKLAERLILSGQRAAGLMLVLGSASKHEAYSLCRVAESVYPKEPKIAYLCLETAHEVVRQREHDEFRSWDLKGIAKSMAKVGFFSEAIDAAGEIESWPDYVEAHGIIAAAIDKARQAATDSDTDLSKMAEEISWDAATAFADWENMAVDWDDGYWKERVLKELCVAWAKIGQDAEALRVLSQVPKEHMETLRQEMAQALIEYGHLATAQNLIEQMAQGWHRGEAWKSVGLAHSQLGCPESARIAFQQAKVDFESLSDTEFDEESRSPSLVDLAIAQTEAGFLEEALHTVTVINNNNWRGEGWQHMVSAFTGIIRVLAQQGEFQSAWECLKKMPLNNNQALVALLVEELRAGECNADQYIFHRVEHLCRRSKAAGARLALQAAQTCREQERRLDSYEPLARAIAEYEEQAPAWRALGQSLASVAEVLINKGVPDPAGPYLRAALDRTLSYSHGPGWYEDFFTLQRIANLQITAGTFDDARETIAAMNTEHIRKDLAQRLECAIAYASDPESKHAQLAIDNKPALDVDDFTQQAQEAQKNGHIDRCAELWWDAGKHALAQGNTETAQKYFAEAIDAAILLEDEEERELLISMILEEQAQLGQPDEAVALANTHLSTSFRLNMLKAACIELWRQNRREAALDILSQIEHPYSVVTIEFEFATWQYQMGEQDEARNRLRSLLQHARYGKFEGWSEQTLEWICRGLIKVGLKREALEAALLISDNDAQDRIWPNIVEELIKSGDHLYWKQLVIRSVTLDVAPWAMCGYLAEAFPNQAEVVGEVLLRHAPGRGR